MSRAPERIIIYIACIWQILTGAITASLYLISVGNSLNGSIETSLLSTAIFIYGMFFVTVGIINAIVTSKLVKDHTVQIKTPMLWVVLAIVFFALADYISLMLLILAIVVSLAKNKSIKVKGKLNTNIS